MHSLILNRISFISGILSFMALVALEQFRHWSGISGRENYVFSFLIITAIGAFIIYTLESMKTRDESISKTLGLAFGIPSVIYSLFYLFYLVTI